MAGAIIDIVDLVTFGPIGLAVGLPVGGLVGYWMGIALGLGLRASFLCALAAGIYCTIPYTEFLPLGTLVGACVRFHESGRPPPQEASPSPPRRKVTSSPCRAPCLPPRIRRE